MNEKIQLFCFPYAGGSADFFTVIEKDLPELQLIKLEYAGHGTRYREAFYPSFQELTDDIFQQLKTSYKDGRYALFGYSMGSITLVEILKRIIQENMTLPICVFLAAHEPHSKKELLSYTENELDEWVIQRTVSFGAVPEKLFNNKTFWRIYLPRYRADYAIIGRYEFEKLDLNTSVPAVFFYSESDTPLTEMKNWETFFQGEVSWHRLEGNHFFILEHHQEMARTIMDKLEIII